MENTNLLSNEAFNKDDSNNKLIENMLNRNIKNKDLFLTEISYLLHINNCFNDKHKNFNFKLPVNLLVNLENLLNNESFDQDLIYLVVKDKIQEVLKSLKSVNDKGFVNNADLLKYPFICECISNLLHFDDVSPDKNKKIKNDNNLNVSLGKNPISISDAKEFYK